MNNSSITPLKRFFRLLEVDRKEILYIYLYAVVGGAITLTLPLGIQAIINLISGGQIATSWGVLIAFVTIGVGFTGIMQVTQLALSEVIKQRIFARSSLEFAFRLPRIRPDSLGGRYLPELVNRFFDTMTVQKGLNKLLLDLPVSGLQIVLGLLLLALYHPFFIAFGLSLVLLLWLIFRYTGQRGLATSLIESKYKYEVAHWLEELGRSINTFKLAGETNLPMSETDRLVDKYIGARKAHFRVLMGQYSAMVVFKVVVTFGLLALGGLLVMNEQMNIGQFVAAEIVILLVINAVEKMIMSIESVYDVLTAVEKIANVTDLPLEKPDGILIPATCADSAGLRVEYRKVGFRSHWSGSYVLREIDLKVEPGEKLCIAGPPGAGKTTLLQMVCGLIAPTEGSVLVDGNALPSLQLDRVRSAIGDSLTQEEIFSGTVLDNITMGRAWVSGKDAQEAAERTGLLPMLGDLPKGLLTVLDPLGSRLPQSLVRRIILARCLAGRPRLVLYEDDAVPLDPGEQATLLGLLTAPDVPFTLIAVSNDPVLHARCQRLVHVEGGRITEDSNT